MPCQTIAARKKNTKKYNSKDDDTTTNKKETQTIQLMAKLSNELTEWQLKQLQLKLKDPFGQFCLRWSTSKKKKEPLTHLPS